MLTLSFRALIFTATHNFKYVKCIYELGFIYTNIYNNIVQICIIVSEIVYIRCQMTSTLIMFPIQDKIVYTLEFKLKCKR